MAVPVWSAAAPALRADAKLAVPLPDLASISDRDAERLLAALAQINVVTSNCPDYRISDEEWMLLTGTGDMLAARLGIDPATYDRKYYGPAFRMMEDPATCDRIGPRARPIIDDLIAMGGGVADGGEGSDDGGNAAAEATAPAAEN
ncbi:hypothetical protein [Paracoccus sp. S1E-3]|uniref:hypothetical protein n=2 Tax=Paracoccus TaxID=265 RepID=UPI0015EE5DDB|nr:hypothetical protein [Paracoccus sp. S1E-3]MBA4490629.1 hypothetical protein [Paracoccus sp. S1E-3]